MNPSFQELCANNNGNRFGIKLNFKGQRDSPKREGKKLRRLDLRQVDKYTNFGATTLTYQLHDDLPPVDLALHRGDPKQIVDLAKDSLTTVLREVFNDVASKNFDSRSVVHVFMHCTGLDQDFKFNCSGEDRITLLQFVRDPTVIEQVVDTFTKIIQSGKPVILDGRCTIRVCVYEPPPGWIEIGPSTSVNLLNYL